MPITADQVAAQEIACATGVGATEVARRLELATAPRRHRVLRERLRAGPVSLQRALRIVVETRTLDDDVIPDLEATVLAPARDGSIASHRLFSERLRRCVRAADPRGHEERRQCCHGPAHGRSVASSRTAWGRSPSSRPAERVVGVLDRVDAMARAARAAGDARSLDQLRSDLLCDLVLFGVVPGPVSVTVRGVRRRPVAATGARTQCAARTGSGSRMQAHRDVAGRAGPACPTPAGDGPHRRALRGRGRSVRRRVRADRPRLGHRAPTPARS